MPLGSSGYQRQSQNIHSFLRYWIGFHFSMMLADDVSSYPKPNRIPLVGRLTLQISDTSVRRLPWTPIHTRLAFHKYLPVLALTLIDFFWAAAASTLTVVYIIIGCYVLHCQYHRHYICANNISAEIHTYCYVYDEQVSRDRARLTT